MIQEKILDTSALESRVKHMYTKVAENPAGEFHFEMGRALAERLGYPSDQLDLIPQEAIDSFAGVGYYFGLADISENAIVVDLGSGSGMDVFFASLKVPHGKVIGIDMTEAQLNKSRALGQRDGFANTEFSEGYIEGVSLPNAKADVVISNGVINLSPSKELVFEEISRILKPGGKLMLSDIVSGVVLPESIKCNAALWAACIGGAVPLEDYIGMIEAGGMEVVTVQENPYKFISKSALGATDDYGIKSVSILAIKKG